MQYELKKIEAKRLGIDEDDVDNCTNFFQLMNWQIEVSKDVANITAQLAKYEVECKKVCGDTNPEWRVKAESSRELLKLLIQKINIKAQELKANRKLSVAEKFMQTAKNVLDTHLFERILKA